MESFETSTVSITDCDLASLSCASESKCWLEGGEIESPRRRNAHEDVPSCFPEVGGGNALQHLDDDADPRVGRYVDLLCVWYLSKVSAEMMSMEGAGFAEETYDASRSVMGNIAVIAPPKSSLEPDMILTMRVRVKSRGQRGACGTGESHRSRHWAAAESDSEAAGGTSARREGTSTCS